MSSDDDDRYAVRLLSPLAGEPQGEPRYDVGRAMREGRQRRRTRFWATGTAVVALTAASITGGSLAVGALNDAPPVPKPSALTPSIAATPSAKPLTCKVSRLPSDGVTKALTTGADPTGRYAVGRLYPPSGKQFDYPLVVWKDGKIVARTRIPGSDSQLNDINSKGAAVGETFVADEIQEAYYYAGSGQPVALAGGRGAYSTTASAINDSGVIVGSVADRPVRWASATAPVERLAMPAGATRGSAIGIDEDGTVLGMVGTDKTQTAYLWLPDGTGRKLPLPPVNALGGQTTRKATSFWAMAIRKGLVTGRAAYETKDSTSFTSYRYDIAANRYQQLSGKAAMPQAIAANGWIASGDFRPYLVTDSATITLPAYGKQSTSGPGGIPDTDYEISGISDDGKTVIGYNAGPGNNDGGATSNNPLIWRCG